MDAMGYLSRQEAGLGCWRRSDSPCQDLRRCSPALALSVTRPASGSLQCVFAGDAATGRQTQIFLGASYCPSLVPAAVNALVSAADFATASTVLVSRGTLPHLFEFQTAVCELTGLDMANASLYDGFSALANQLMAVRLTRGSGLAVSAGIHPEARREVRSEPTPPVRSWRSTSCPYPRRADGPKTTLPMKRRTASLPAARAAAELLWGHRGSACARCRRAGALLVVMQNPMTFGLLPAAGLLGADIVVGDLRGVGNAVFRRTFGRLPGLPGKSTCDSYRAGSSDDRPRRARLLHVDLTGPRAAHPPSEGHIQYLLQQGAVGAGRHHLPCSPEPGGLRRLGEICAQRQAGLRALPGVSRRFSGPFFHEFRIDYPMPAGDFVENGGARHPAGRLPGALPRPAWIQRPSCGCHQ